MATTHTAAEELPLSVQQAANRLHAAREEVKAAGDAFLKSVESYGKEKVARKPAPLPQEDTDHAE